MKMIESLAEGVEDFISENEQETCEYCTDVGDRKEYEYNGNTIYIDVDGDLDISTECIDWTHTAYIKINNCPWCGRKLNDEK